MAEDRNESRWDHVILSGSIECTCTWKCVKCGRVQRSSSVFELKSNIDGTKTEAKKKMEDTLRNKVQSLNGNILGVVGEYQEQHLCIEPICPDCGTVQPWAEGTPFTAEKTYKTVDIAVGILWLATAFAAFMAVCIALKPVVPANVIGAILVLLPALLCAGIVWKIFDKFTSRYHDRHMKEHTDLVSGMPADCMPEFTVSGEPDVTVDGAWNNGSD